MVGEVEEGVTEGVLVGDDVLGVSVGEEIRNPTVGFVVGMI